MLDFNMSEMVVVAIVALLVIGPKDLPKAMRFVGYWVGRARGVARQFRSGFDSMVREAELAEMEKKWAEENARIMREHPPEPAAQPVAQPVALEGPPAPDTATDPALLPVPDADDGPVTTPPPVIRDEPGDPADPAAKGQS
ncbi:twin-arginine translocase subunit TatB [Sphingomonas spermidinifaciens]|uniref:Twin-arginine translocase subunit TatB n=1 Tax=Sphingomonas spermidinifaciens TaxID=1141889 RepID=A0A2A4B859_9SPHN|nr:Sec-independent protein translocase protein TatB [Sphingomonas spermidinifaciens]PCD03948.1 twin-arginine translocase subunit TatB [Sphingomonas spermidinifaciens]